MTAGAEIKWMPQHQLRLCMIEICHERTTDIRSDVSSKMYSFIMQNLDLNWLVGAVPKQITVRLGIRFSWFPFFHSARILTGNKWLLSTAFA